MPLLAEHVDKLAQGVLRLRHRQPVARHDDHPVGVAEQDRDVLGSGRPHRPVGGLAAAQRRAALEGAEQDVDDRAAHGLRHQPGQQRSGGTDERARDQQQGVAEHVAAGRHRQAGERVQQRDHDRHVGTADGQHEQHAERQPEQAQHDAHPQDRVGDQIATESATAARSEPPKATGSPGKITGRVVISSCSLAKVTSRAGEADRADQDRERGRGQVECRLLVGDAAELGDLVQLEQGDQRSRPAADAVEHARPAAASASSARAARRPRRRRSRSRSRSGSADRWSRSSSTEDRHASPAPRRTRRAGCRCAPSSATTGP